MAATASTQTVSAQEAAQRLKDAQHIERVVGGRAARQELDAARTAMSATAGVRGRLPVTDDQRARWACGGCGDSGLAAATEHPVVDVDSAIYWGWLVHQNRCTQRSDGLQVEVIGHYDNGGITASDDDEDTDGL